MVVFALLFVRNAELVYDLSWRYAETKVQIGTKLYSHRQGLGESETLREREMCLPSQTGL